MANPDDLLPDRVVFDRFSPTLRTAVYAAACLWYGFNGHYWQQVRTA